MREYYPNYLKFIDDALEMAKNIPRYFSKFSNKIYCNHQKLAMFVLMQKLKTTSRGVISWLRWILVECTLTSIKKKHRLQRFYLRIKHKRGTQKAIVATARKMLTTIWHLLNKNQYYVP